VNDFEEGFMITVPVPGWGELSIEYVMVDFNGTAALDGKLKKEVKEIIDNISRYVKVFVITADTYETADAELGLANVAFIKVGKSASGEEKAKVVRELGPEKIVAIGNGANDALMLKEAALGIAVVGEEGCSTALMKEADLLVTDVVTALGLVAHPERLVATLRD
jgi:P-type E1-E2 ATPase